MVQTTLLKLVKLSVKETERPRTTNQSRLFKGFEFRKESKMCSGGKMDCDWFSFNEGFDGQAAPLKLWVAGSAMS